MKKMIEKIVLDYLAPLLPVPVMLEIPPDPPEKFVVLEKTGGRVENGLCYATLVVQSYGKTLWEALRLHETVKAVMRELDVLDGICRVELNSDYRFPDPAAKRRRYQAVFDVVYYGDPEH